MENNANNEFSSLVNKYKVEVFVKELDDWIVCDEAIGLTEAINKFRTVVLNSDLDYRLTSPLSARTTE